MAKIANKVKGTSIVTFSFSDGQTVVADLTTFPEEIVMQLAVHGMSQKGGDSYASANDNGLTIADCADGVRDIIGNLASGVWSAAGGSGSSINAEAMSRITGESLEACAEVIAAMDEDEVKALLKRADMKAMVARIKAERAEVRADAAAGDADASDLAGLFNK